MNQAEFSILVTNLAAIATETFSIRCSVFATELQNDPDPSGSAPTETNEQTMFNLDEYFSQADLQAMLDSGYAQLDELQTELNTAMEIVEPDMLSDLLSQLPSGFPDLSYKLTVDQFKIWLTYAADAKDDDPFYAAHDYVMAAFAGGDDLDMEELGLDDDDDDIQNLVQEAIALNEIQILIDNESDITADKILLNDLIMAVFNDSLEPLKWLLKRAKLTDEEQVLLLNSCLFNPDTFKMVYAMQDLDDTQQTEILELAVESEQQEVIDFLQQTQTA